MGNYIFLVFCSTVNNICFNYCSDPIFSIKEAGKVVDITNIKHIAEDKQLIGDLVEKTAKDWEAEIDLFCQQTGFCRQPVQPPLQQEGNSLSKCSEIAMQMEEGNDINYHENHENLNDEGENGDFGKELEEILQSLPLEEDDKDF